MTAPGQARGEPVVCGRTYNAMPARQWILHEVHDIRPHLETSQIPIRIETATSKAPLIRSLPSAPLCPGSCYATRFFRQISSNLLSAFRRSFPFRDIVRKEIGTSTPLSCSGEAWIMQRWMRTAVFTLVIAVAVVLLLVFLSIAIRIALVLALLAAAYYFFSRGLAARRHHRDWRS